MTVCPRCQWRYPEELVTHMNANGTYVLVCGICALAFTNEIHGTASTAFKGEQAELLRQNALAWRASHPGGGPAAPTDPQLSPEGQELTIAWTPSVLPVGWTVGPLGDNTFRHIHRKLVVILTVEREADGLRWLHISLSQRDRLPTWQELKDVKDWLVGRDRVAVQVLPREEEFVNLHPHCLHLWSCLDKDVVPDFRKDGIV